MPTYEYECTNCGEVVEIVQPITEPTRRRLRKNDPKPCDCNATVKRRIGTGGALIFKGSGFYETDYRSEGYKKAAKADADAASGKSKSDSDGKSDKSSDKAGEKKSSGSSTTTDTKTATKKKNDSD